MNKTDRLHKQTAFMQTPNTFHNFGSTRSFVFANWCHRFVRFAAINVEGTRGERGPARFGPFVPFLPQVSA